MKKTIWLIAITALLYSCNIREQSDIQKDVMASEEIISVSSDSLLTLFTKDSIAANELYMNKVLSVTGEVALFEMHKPIQGQVNDSLPWVLKWFVNRMISDLNTSNIGFRHPGIFKKHPPYSLAATFPKEYREELKGVKEKSKVTVKGSLEHVSTIYQTLPDSTRKPIAYVLSLQGCVLEKVE